MVMTSDEFEQWGFKNGLSERSMAEIGRIRGSQPSRKVSGLRSNVIGAYPSRKMGKSIQFESHKVELPVLYLMEHNDSVKEMYDQPPQIKLSYKSLKEKVVTIFHTPDYFVMLEDKAGWVECKKEEQLCELAEKSPNRYVLIDGKWHCPPGEEYAKQFGLHYWVKSSSEINWQLQRNITFLEDYWLDKKTELLSEVVETVLSCVRTNPGILLIDLLRTPGVEADDIYYLIVRENIYVDLKEELLSEPEFTHVFIDEQTAFAYKTMTSRKSIPILKDCTVEVAPGTKVTWDGKPWTIVNLGERNITLVADGNVIDIEKNQFYNLICEHRIQGIDNELVKSANSVLNSIIAEASEQDLREAIYRYKVILPILEGKATTDIGIVGVTSRTIRNWLNNYRQAEQRYGSGFIGLIPRKSKRGNRTPHLPEETLTETIDFIIGNENVTNQSIKVLYGKFLKQCKVKGIDAPSSKTFKKIIKQRPIYQRVLNTKGSRMAYQYEEFYWLDEDTPRHGERPFQIAHLDHTEIDLELVHSETGKNLGKAWITLMVDAYTRRILAFFITFDAPSYRSDMMIIRECVRRFNRLPETIITDNGKDFKSIYFQSLLALYGITHKLRPPKKSRHGSVGERMFGTTMSQLIHNLQGNTKIMKNVRQVTKSVNPRNHAVWTLSALYQLLNNYFYGFYDTREHSSLGESPRECFEREMAISGSRPFRFIPYDEDFIIMTLPSVKNENGTRQVDPQRGIKVKYLYYYCDKFYKPDVAGTRVPVRYDPWNKGIVYSFVRGSWVICYSQYYSVFKRRTENEIRIASEELMKQKQDNGRKADFSARELAEFISGGEATEELLKQRFHDSEMTSQFLLIEGGRTSSSNEVHEVSQERIKKKFTFDLDEDDDY